MENQVYIDYTPQKRYNILNEKDGFFWKFSGR